MIELYQEKRKTEISILYFEGLMEIKNKNYEKAEVLFEKIIRNADVGYTLLSYFKLANINLNKKNFQSMEMYYDKIMSLDNINKAYKDYALILKITNSPNINNDDKIKALKPFLNSPSEFQPIASELEILYLIENKKMKIARNKLDKPWNKKVYQIIKKIG